MVDSVFVDGFRCFCCGRVHTKGRVRSLGGGLYICLWCDGIGGLDGEI